MLRRALWCVVPHKHRADAAQRCLRCGKRLYRLFRITPLSPTAIEAWERCDE